MEKKTSQARIETVMSAINVFFVAAAMAFALLSLSRSIVESESATLKIFLFLLFLSLALSRGVLAWWGALKTVRDKVFIFKNIIFSLVYLVIGIIALIIPYSDIVVSIIGSGYMGTVVANRIFSIIKKHTLGNIVINLFFGGIALFVLVTFLFVIGTPYVTEVFLLFVLAIIFVSLAEILAYAFSKIQLRGLLNIIRKTYVLEILYGLIVLMVAFAFYFATMEEGIASFGDGLWYCFAIVTTIGFGDITVTSVVGRVLSAILGVYGIIVVASITSVIVNYYNEVKNPTQQIENQAKEEKSEEKENKDSKK